MSVSNASASLPLSQRIILCSSGIPLGIAYVIAPILPQMEAALAHDATDRWLIKMALSIPIGAMVLAAPAAGFLADKMGRAPIMICALLLYAVFGCSGFFIDNLYLMVASRFLMGLAGSTVLTTGLTMIGDTDPVTNKRYQGVQVGVATFCVVLMMFVGGRIGDIFWRLPFLFFLITLPLAVIAYFGLKGQWRRKPADVRPGVPPGTEKFPIPYALMLLAVVVGISNLSGMTYLPFALKNVGLSTATAISTVLMIQQASTVLFSIFFGRARARLSYEMVFVLAFASMGIALTVIGLSHVLALTIAALVIMGCGMGWMGPNIVAHTVENVSLETRGRTVGLVKGTYMAASFLAVFALEPIVRTYGPGGTLVVVGLWSLCGSLYFIFQQSRRLNVQPA